MSDFNKEEFLEDIHSFGPWVKTPDDLLKFLKHIQYRLFQSQEMVRWYSSKAKLSPEEQMEILKISKQYDDAYGNDTSEFQSFDEIFNKGK